jgi:NAD(P)-dependent dehydrogenase (short-subunit alcohol dehydrogenase family)
MAKRKLLEGKVAIITGAGNGIGRSHALLFAQHGARVVVNDLGGARDGSGGNARFADQVVAEVRAAGGEAVASYDSVATMEGGRAILKAALDAFGRVDVLVNNAGILRDKTLLKMDEAQWDVVVAVHLKGTFAVTQPVATWMKEHDVKGSIVNTSSRSGLLGNFGQANYGAAKAGIYGFTRVAALELKKAGIRVNAIAPVALTRLTEDLPMMEGVTNEMLGPDFISPIVLFLASDLSEGITGKIVGVRGNQLYLYRMVEGQAAVKEGDGGMWTAEEIGARWAEIAKGDPS